MDFNILDKISYVDTAAEELVISEGIIVGLSIRLGRLLINVRKDGESKYIDSVYCRADGFNDWEIVLEEIDMIRKQVVVISKNSNEDIEVLRRVLLGDDIYEDYKDME